MQVQPSQEEQIPFKAAHASPQRFDKRWPLVFLLYFAVSVMFQSITGVYRSEFGHSPDEASHVVTSLMIRDYLVSGFHKNPIQYAEDYYIHYPKVAIGMWPPAFHTTVAIWTLLFGASRTSLLLFIALQASILALTLAAFAGKLFGRTAGIFLGLLLLCLPLVQLGISSVMLDISIAILEFWAMVFCVRYFKDERLTSAVLFGFCSAAAMLTKGTANGIVLVPVLLLVLTRRFSLLRKPGLYVAAVIVVLLGVPWQILSWRLYQGTIPIAHVDLRYIWSVFSGYMLILLKHMGPALCLLALLGLVVESGRLLFRRSNPLSDADYAMAGAISLLIAIIVFHCVAPVPGPEPRYMIPALPLLLIAFAAGIRWLAERIPMRVPLAARASAIAGIAVVIFASTTFAIPSRPDRGFIEAVDALFKTKVDHEAVMIYSDSKGEGAFITEIALRDRRPDRIVLRASKVVSEDPWSAPDKYRPLLHSPAETEQYLESVPVDSIVIDLTEGGWPQDRELLLSTMRRYPSKWVQIAEFPEDVSHHHLLLYRRVGAEQDTRTKDVRIRMRFTLGRDLALKP